MKERGRVRTMDQVLAEAWRKFKVEDFKETGTMANLKPDELQARLDEERRSTEYMAQRSRFVEDLLRTAIGQVAEARTDLVRNEKRISDADLKAHQAHWRQEHLIQRIEMTSLWIQEDHLKREPRHKKRLLAAVQKGGAVHKGCGACELIVELAQYVHHQKREVSR